MKTIPKIAAKNESVYSLGGAPIPSESLSEKHVHIARVYQIFLEHDMIGYMLPMHDVLAVETTGVQRLPRFPRGAYIQDKTETFGLFILNEERESVAKFCRSVKKFSREENPDTLVKYYTREVLSSELLEIERQMGLRGERALMREKAQRVLPEGNQTGILLITQGRTLEFVPLINAPFAPMLRLHFHGVSRVALYRYMFARRAVRVAPSGAAHEEIFVFDHEKTAQKVLEYLERETQHKPRLDIASY